LLHPKLLLALGFSIGLLAGCGGGGSSSNEPEANPTPVTPVPVVTQSPDPRLLARTWFLEKASTATGAPLQPTTRVVAAGQEVWLDFANSFYRSFDGCNPGFESGYAYSADELRFDPTREGRISLQTGCPSDNEQVGALLYYLLLNGARWTIVDGTTPRLSLRGSDGALFEFNGAYVARLYETRHK
jgi:hypothetical protein